MLYKIFFIYFEQKCINLQDFLKFGTLHVMGGGGGIPLKPPKAIGLE